MTKGYRRSRDVRARFQEDRARVIERHRRGDPGGAVVRAYSRLVDGAVRTLAGIWLPSGTGVAVAAVGGYGRGELAFASDVDLHLVHTAEEPPEEAPGFIRSLWDLGWEVGHGVVTPDQALQGCREDIQTLTAYLELRHVWGAEEVTEALDRRVREEVLAPGRDGFLEAKVRELERRHAGSGDTVYLAEPEVKEGPGGLRDLHTLLWLSNASGKARIFRDYLEERDIEAPLYRRLRGSWDLLWRVRNTLHLLKGRPWDRLDHRSQVAAASSLAYEEERGRLPVEVFMRDYYRAAREVFTFARLELARADWPLEEGRRTMLTVLHPDTSGAGPWPVSELERDPVEVVRRFTELARTRGTLHPDTASWLHRKGRTLGRAASRDPSHGPAFLDLLRCRHAAWSLHGMHQLGILGGLLPEFERIAALVQYDPYHRYTVDEHTLRMVDVLEDLCGVVRGGGLEPGGLAHPGSPGLERTLSELPLEDWEVDREDEGILRLAILYHDAAKGTGSGRHAERGARLVRKAGERLGLAEEELADAAFLVRHHLALSAASQRRDLTDPALIQRLVRIVRTPRRLRLLGLLTVCDLAAVGPGVLTPWKGRLISDLTGRVAARLAGEGVPGPERERERLLEGAPAGELPELEAFLAGMPGEYLQGLDLDRLRADRGLLEEYLAEGAGRPRAEIRHGAATSQLTLAARDRPRLLSRVCGLLASRDLTIRRARIFTRLDGVVFDRFTVSDAEGGGPMGPRQESEVRELIVPVAEGEREVEPLIEAHRDRWRMRDRPRMRYPVRVTWDEDASERYSVLEVRAADHVGLLHEITSCISETGAAIHQAFITTEGERAVDAFYVTDPLGAPLDRGSRGLLETRLRGILEEEEGG
ncbi:MAG: [protein-PII] uridylyltransferase [bacterium]